MMRSKNTMRMTFALVAIAEIVAILRFDSSMPVASLFNLLIYPASAYVFATVVWFLVWLVLRFRPER
jgi:hypothetical protein